ncbi:MAG: ABC transporter ATP-binding protein [Acidimicrobiia bacterium]|jgi:ABC-type multidrug transport system fused ATPase/permease subunit
MSASARGSRRRTPRTAPDATVDHSLRATIGLTTSFLGDRRWRLGLLAGLAALSGFAEALVLVILARLAFVLASNKDTVVITAGPLGNWELDFWTLLAIAAVLVLVRGMLQVVVAFVASRMWTSVLAEVREEMLAGYLGASWALQSDERSGRLQELVSSFASTAAGSVSLLSQGLVALFSLIAFALTAFAVSVVAALAVAAAGILMALFLRPIRSRVRASAGESARAGLAMATDVNELADGMLEVRVFDVEAQVLDRARTGIRTTSERERHLRIVQQLGPALYQTAALLLIVVCVAVIGLADISKLGAIGGVVLVMIRSLSYAQQLQNTYQAFHAGAPSLELLRAELDRFEAAAVDRSGAPFDHIGELAFEHVGFAYEPGIDTIVDMSFRVPPGEIVGIVGPSGAGKSTVVQLLLRLREPGRGRVLADGRDVAGLSLTDWYRRVAFVPQASWLFAGTVAENIAFFREGVSREAIERSARQANLHDEIMAMPDGYDAFVGERGGQISGGQRQRLCIARALVEEPDVLVLDEPTSALDVRSEALIRETLAALAPRTTVFIIAHRMSTLEICDRIMVLFEGRLEGFDEPDRLAATNHFYREALSLSGLR